MLNLILCSIEESLYRPEAIRWRKRMELLKPIDEPIVILPCSATKPYSRSLSHQIFRRVTKGYQELILTSPFGICPREMEETYPIRAYDVSTTGEWYFEEKKVVGELLKKYVGDKKVIAHVVGGYKEVCEEYLDECIFTCEDKSPISKESMNNLRTELSKYEKIPRKKLLLHKLKSIAIYQFGKGAEILIPENCRVRGRRNKIILDENRNHICTLSKNFGLYNLTLEGGKRLLELGTKQVEIDFKPKTNKIFAPGVIEADESIVPRDEVIVTYKGDIVGVGKAVLSGNEMVKADYGVAVKIRRLKK